MEKGDQDNTSTIACSTHLGMPASTSCTYESHTSHLTRASTFLAIMVLTPHTSHLTPVTSVVV
jgi:hypothetical protein